MIADVPCFAIITGQLESQGDMSKQQQKQSDFCDRQQHHTVQVVGIGIVGIGPHIHEQIPRQMHYQKATE